jgi:manganese efflux pump family protein
MNLAAIFLIAIGLSMDAFAVAVSHGGKTTRHLYSKALLVAFFFGSFQAIMPALGWMAGQRLRSVMASCDHWIAFGLLSLVGCKMIFESFRKSDNGEDAPEVVKFTLHLLVVLSIATSIDALSVGFTLSFLGAGLLRPVLIIGAVTFVVSGVGMLIGNRFGRILGKRFEFIGGLLLIAIGLQILLSHVCGT